MGEGGAGDQPAKIPLGDQAPDTDLLNSSAILNWTVDVGSYSEGACSNGILDVAGNVWEWKEDWWNEDFYAISPRNNLTGPEASEERAIRGGGYFSPVIHVESAGRGLDSPGFSGPRGSCAV